MNALRKYESASISGGVGMSAPQSLAAILTALTERHGVHVVQFGTNLKQDESARFDCSFQWNGHSNTGHCCASEHGATMEEALAKAVGKMITAREQPADLSNVVLETAA